MQHPVIKLSLHLYIQARYGNPDVQILGTLKIKLHIYRFLNMPSKNMGSIFIFRVAIYLWITKLADMWQPWKSKYVKNVEKLIKLSCTIQIMSQAFKKLRFCFTLQETYSVHNTYARPISHSEVKTQFLKSLWQNLNSAW